MATLTRAVDVEELYGIESWGSRYFSVNTQGQLVVDDQEKQVSLLKIIQGPKRAGLRHADDFALPAYFRRSYQSVE